jgi:hypothetical protein
MTEDFRVQFKTVLAEWIAERDLEYDREELAVGRFDTDFGCHSLFV